MKTKFMFLIGIQVGFLITAITLPVQAAVLVGTSQPLAGSVVSLRSSLLT